jgi:glutathione synthase/RimK-type ligase-like ATP-grasp enzyme
MFRLRPVGIRQIVGDSYRKRLVDAEISALPSDAIVPIDQSEDVLLLCSQMADHFDAKIYVQELAFAHELAARGRTFAVSTDPSSLFNKSVAWFLPNRLIFPRLWNYSRQVHEFALGLEEQGNRLFCSSHEVRFWENKTYMHQELDERNIPTPATKILADDSWQRVAFDIEPVLVKEEHSSGSLAIHYFASADAARTFVSSYPFRPGESLIMQRVVPGATKDLRVTIVGDTVISAASYWRTKSPDALRSEEWTTTATTFNSIVEHGAVPDAVISNAKKYLRALGLRTAGIDIIWPDDDTSSEGLVLELSPYYQPNPPKPDRYRDWTYKQYKQKAYIKQGYLFEQYSVFRTIAAAALDQNLY